MYCIKCGVELGDSEKSCPLCGTPVFHPDIKREEGERLYPEYIQTDKKYNRRAMLIILTAVFALTAMIPTLLDIRLCGGISWSGYVIGGLGIFYVSLVLPYWFKRPNPVIFIPSTFAAVELFLLYTSLHTGGGWFLSFGFPVTGILGIIITTVAAMVKYIKKGHFFIFGGMIIALGGYIVLIELFIHVTFGVRFIFWSLYPLICLVTVGALLIVIGSCRPMREALGRKFFI